MHRILICLILILVPLPSSLMAQKLSEFPGHDRYLAGARKRFSLGRNGMTSNISWAKDFSKFSYVVNGEKKTFDLQKIKIIPNVDFEVYKPEPAPTDPRGKLSPVGRALQREVEPSYTGKWLAIYKDFNVVIRSTDDPKKETKISDKGNEKLRYGTCCWVYGEELDQNTAMWWSPDDSYLAFYEVSESHMRDYYLTIDNTKSYTNLNTVRYPKAGDPNPKVAILIYDLKTKATIRAKIEGEETQYLFNVRWTPDGKELLVNRTNRQQNILDVFAVDPSTGKSRIVLTEKQDTWQKNSPEMRFLADKQRFIWETEKNGWKNYELRDLSGKLINPLTNTDGYPVSRIVSVDEKAGWMYYSAYSAENPYNLQLHRVRLDGTKNSRITTSPLNHTFNVISPDHRWVVSRMEDISTPPQTVIYSADGKLVATLEKATIAPEDQKYMTAELFSFTAADGKTKIYGTLHKPTDFDPSKKYPLVIDVYGGPSSVGISNSFRPFNPYCEFGVCIAKIGNRGTVNRGKAFESATYLKLGGPDIQDQADGVRKLAKREYIDGSRVGILGHSYGGYMSALALLKYPEDFHVGVAGAPVTKWGNYDTIYTERYMQTPQLNAAGYKLGDCMEYAENLQGKLLLVHGLIDDNVHPANTWQLAEALHRADKRFDMQIYPNFKHGIGSTYFNLRWEYLLKNLKAK